MDVYLTCATVAKNKELIMRTEAMAIEAREARRRRERTKIWLKTASSFDYEITKIEGAFEVALAGKLLSVGCCVGTEEARILAQSCFITVSK